MRQVGVLCAAAKVALETGVERLAEDHANAKRLALGIAHVWPGSIDPGDVETNILYVRTGDRDAEVTAGALKEKGVLVGPMGARRLRLVTHRDVDAQGIERAIDAFGALA